VRSFLVVFFIVYLLNQFSFIFYNYSWFSLLCSTYIIDFYNQFYFLFFNLNTVHVTNNIFFENINLFMSDRWYFILDFFYIVSLYEKIHEQLFFQSKVDLDLIYCVYFDTKVIGFSDIYFYVLQNKLFILPGETTLSFFRIYNENSFPISGITIYSITPFEFQSFVNKIQCFCFEEIIVHSFEVIELPVLFYIDTNVRYLDLIQIKELCIEYVLLCSKVA
jgi:Cytochrome c oxidase assembly protein CtaG/Cox11